MSCNYLENSKLPMNTLSTTLLLISSAFSRVDMTRAECSYHIVIIYKILEKDRCLNNSSGLTQ